MTIQTWNTGRMYGAKGQRIAAERIGDVVIFNDIDRGIWGAFHTHSLASAGLDLQYLVMARYDHGDYTHPCSAMAGEDCNEILRRLGEEADEVQGG